MYDRLHEIFKKERFGDARRSTSGIDGNDVTLNTRYVYCHRLSAILVSKVFLDHISSIQHSFCILYTHVLVSVSVLFVIKFI